MLAKNANFVCLIVAGLLLSGLAIAQESTTPLKDPRFTAYGSFRLALSEESRSDDMQDFKITDELSRVGILGKVPVNSLEDTSVIYRIELRLFADEGNLEDDGSFRSRHSWVGLSAPWGNLTIGKQWNASWFWTNRLVGGGFNDVSIITSRDPYHRMNNIIVYKSARLGNFQWGSTLMLGGDGSRLNGYMSDGDNNGNTIDYYNLTARYLAGGLELGIAHHEIADDSLDPAFDGYSSLQLAAKYKTEKISFYAMLQSESIDSVSLGADKIDTTVLGISYLIDANYSIRLRHAIFENGFVDDSGTSTAFGYQYKFDKNLRYWVEFALRSTELEDDELVNAATTTTVPAGGFDNIPTGDEISIGLRFDF